MAYIPTPKPKIELTEELIEKEKKVYENYTYEEKILHNLAFSVIFGVEEYNRLSSKFFLKNGERDVNNWTEENNELLEKEVQEMHYKMLFPEG